MFDLWTLFAAPVYDSGRLSALPILIRRFATRLWVDTPRFPIQEVIEMGATSSAYALGRRR